MKRTLQDWANISQIIGAVAVVLSLLYVGYEVRQSRVATENAARQQDAALDMAYLATSLDPAVVARALARQEQHDSLTPLEFSQLEHKQHMNFRIFENAYYLYRRGALERTEWERYQRIIGILICNDAPTRSMWRDFTFDPSFTAVVDQIRASCAKPVEGGATPVG